MDLNVKICNNEYKSGPFDFLMTFYGMKGKYLAIAPEAR